MKILIISSKVFYDKIPEIQKTLEDAGHVISLPNCVNDPGTEARYRNMGIDEHAKWKAGMLRHSADVIRDMDAVLVLNFEKNGVKNYIGGATFLEMYEAFKLNKKIFLYNDIPEGMLKDEISGFSPIVINGELGMVI